MTIAEEAARAGLTKVGGRPSLREYVTEVWRRRSFVRWPGTVVVEILDPIPPGLEKSEFFARLQNDIETATARLVAEGQRELAAKGY